MSSTRVFVILAIASAVLLGTEARRGGWIPLPGLDRTTPTPCRQVMGCVPMAGATGNALMPMCMIDTNNNNMLMCTESGVLGLCDNPDICSSTPAKPCTNYCPPVPAAGKK